MKRIALLLCLLLLTLSACQSLSEKRQSTQLEDTLRNYEAMVRWGDLSQVQQFASAGPDDAVQHVTPGLRVTGYQVVQGPSLLDPEHAVQTVIIEYVFESTQQVREVVDRQVWHYDPETQSWSRQSPLPDFR